MSNLPEQQQLDGQQQSLSSEQVQDSLWPLATRAPSEDPDFRILFHGLLSFARNESYGANREHVSETGVHTKAADHKFAVGVFEHQPPAEPGGEGPENLLY